MPKLLAMVEQYGSWTVLGDAGYRGPCRLIRVRCACGYEGTRQAGSIRGGRSTSCGCSRRNKSEDKETTA